MSIEFVFIGLLVGWLVGMTGVGGASLLTPLLIFMGIHPTIAIGTDFAYNSITKMVGAIQHIRQKTVHFQLVKYLAIGSIPSAVTANIVFYLFLADYYNKEFVMLLLGSILMIVSIITLIQMTFGRHSVNRWKEKPLEEKRHLTILAGVIIGAIVGVTSVGSGSLFALFILYVYNMKSSELVGTDVTHAFLLTSISGLLMAGFGHIDYLLVGNLLCGSIPGAIIGSKLTTKVPSKYIRIVMIVIIFISGMKLVF
ncbi:hypothetical protein COE51_17100 [Bacillus pseudomycoides]|nr:hypothetical protein COE51_17100 [Bacillus pseudomycoides]